MYELFWKSNDRTIEQQRLKIHLKISDTISQFRYTKKNY